MRCSLSIFIICQLYRHTQTSLFCVQNQSNSLCYHVVSAYAVSKGKYKCTCNSPVHLHATAEVRSQVVSSAGMDPRRSWWTGGGIESKVYLCAKEGLTAHQAAFRRDHQGQKKELFSSVPAL